MKIKKYFIAILFAIFFFLVLTGCPAKFIVDTNNPYDGVQLTVTENFAPNESWTFMIYLDGDNNLEPAAIDDFDEMVSGLNGLGNPNINVIVLMDKASIDDTKLYEINQSNSYTMLDGSVYNLPSDTGNIELNMGDPANLTNFINYCKNIHSSQHYALILWNHGGGAKSKDISANNNNLLKAVCWDETDNSDCLYLDEVQQALTNAGFNSSTKLDFIGFDACLMGTVEVAYEFRDLALVMAGSMASEWGDGWDYDALFKGMSVGSNNDPKELGKLVVKTYHDSTSSQLDQTQAAIDLTKISDLKDIIDNFAVSLYYENKKSDIEILRDKAIHFYDIDENSIDYPYFDLNDIAYQILGNAGFFSTASINNARDIIDTLSNVIIAAYAGSNYGNYYGYGSDVRRGLSIFFSRGNLTFTYNNNNYSHYEYQWWYTNVDTNQWNSGYLYGKIDFADSNENGTVETWRELFEKWYDPTNTYTPSSY
ncbi:MAG: clostripain-related cysteine peptidase [Spirochaetota bacterium]